MCLPDSSDSEAVDGEEGEEVMATLRKKMKELSAAHELVVKNRCVNERGGGEEGGGRGRGRESFCVHCNKEWRERERERER